MPIDNFLKCISQGDTFEVTSTPNDKTYPKLRQPLLSFISACIDQDMSEADTSTDDVTLSMNSDTRFDFREHSLTAAATRGDLGTVKRLVQSGINVDAEGFNRMLFYASKNYLTPLQLAASEGHSECVEFLIENGADVNAKDRFDVTALHMAAERGHFACVKALLCGNADCSPPTKHSKVGCYTAIPHLGGTTPLHLAAANNHVEIIQQIIQYGGDYNAVDEKGRTSLYIAAQNGFKECVLEHLKNAVGRDILSLPCFETSDTPLHFAVTHSMVECVRALLETGSDVSHCNLAGFSPLHLAVAPSIKNKDVGMDILRMLVLDGYNTDINQKDKRDQLSPLHHVTFHSNGTVEIAKFLIAYGADVAIKSRGCSLLEWELGYYSGNSDVLKYILRSILHPPRLHTIKVQGPNSMLSTMMHNQRCVCKKDMKGKERSERHAWYEHMATNPRTLQHYCRFSVRKCLGPKCLRSIHNLPIPIKIKSYLLLEELGD